MAIEVFNRYEHKYLLDKKTYEKVLEIMDEHMELDSHNPNHRSYTIANIYFDTEDDYLIRRSLEKPQYKEKLRMRAYGVPGEESKVFLEIKKKYHGIVNKRRTTIGLMEAYKFTESGEMPPVKEYMNKQVLHEIVYFLHQYQPKPKVYLAYNRIAYFERGNPDLRISFDTNIRTRRCNVHLEEGDYGEALLDEHVYLMEIKTARTMPLWLAHTLAKLNIHRCSFSKYGTEFMHFVHSDSYHNQIQKESGA